MLSWAWDNLDLLDILLYNASAQAIKIQGKTNGTLQCL